MHVFRTWLGRRLLLMAGSFISLLVVVIALLITQGLNTTLVLMLLMIAGVFLTALLGALKQNQPLQAASEQLVLQAIQHTAQHELAERRRAEELLLQQNAQLALIQMTMIELLRNLEPHQLIEGILERASELLGTAHGYVYLLDAATQQLTCAIGVGIFQQNIGQQATPGVGIAGTVWQTHKPLVVDDYDTWPQRVPSRPRGRIKQIVGVPLLADKQLLGILGIGYQQDKKIPFGERELDLLRQFARLAAIALQNAQLFAAEQRARHTAEALREANAVVAATLHKEEALTRILEQLRRVIDFDEASVMLVRNDRLVISATTGEAFVGNIEERSFPLDQSSGAGLVIKRRAPVLIEDVTNSPDWVPMPEPTRSWLGVPLIAKGEVIGVLNMGAFSTQCFTDHDREVALSFANQAVIAIENARLFEDAQRRAHEAETLREASAVVAATLSQEQAITLILEQLQRVVPHDSASVQLLSPDGADLMIVGGHGVGYDQRLVGTIFPIPGPNPNTSVIQQRRPLWISDVEQNYTGFKRFEFEMPIRSWMGVPLIVRGRIIGMLTVDKFERGYFTEDYARLASAFADQVAIAIENANLYSSAQQEIAERRRAEEQLRQAKEEAEAATRTKSEFLATMSHEIRTPMNGVLGLADVLLSTTIDADQRQIIEMIRTSGDGLLRVIDDILDFSKIEAGKLEIEHRAFDLRQCVKTALDIVTPRIAAKGLRLIAQLDPSAPSAVLGDPIRLQQIMINLLGNAVKFTEQGEIELTVIYERLKHAPHQYRIFCAVRDTGIGIPPERMDRLFQSFSQVDASMTRLYGGTGLGLAICKQLCRLMGGEIWVESAPSEGSIFSFTVVVDAVEAAEQPHNDPSASAASSGEQPSLAEQLPLRVLLAEDHPINQRVATLMLERLGYHADVAANGREVLALLDTQAYDVVLMDMQMPELDGLETTHQIRARWPDAERPIIIALTANAMQGDRERCLAAGMNDYLSKPIRQHELREIIERWGTHIDAAQHAGEQPMAAASPTAEAIIDHRMIDEMRATGALNELIALFFNEAPALLATIRTAAEQADFAALARATHTLRGSSSYLGATTVVAQAQALEDAALARDHSTAVALLSTLENAYAQVVEALQALQAAPCAGRISQVY